MEFGERRTFARSARRQISVFLQQSGDAVVAAAGAVGGATWAEISVENHQRSSSTRGLQVPIRQSLQGVSRPQQHGFLQWCCLQL